MDDIFHSSELNILDMFPDPIRIINRDGKIVFVNEHYCKLVSKSKDELYGAHFSSVFHPNSQSETRVLSENNFLKDLSLTRTEFISMLWNSEKIWLGCSHSKINFNGMDYILSIIRDITDTKNKELQLEESQERYRTLFNNTNNAMFVSYLNYGKILGNFVEVNDVAVKWLGITKDILYQMNPQSIIFNNSEGKSLEVIEKLLANKQAIFDGIHLAKNGSRINVEISSHLFTFNGRQAVLFISRDLTQRYKVEAKLKAAGEQLRQLAIHLQSIREEERKLIAREIHDELGQVLTVLKIQLSVIFNSLTEKPQYLLTQFQSLIKLIDNSIESVHKITSKLRPDILDELGLVAAIEWQTKQFTNTTGIVCDTFLPPDEIQLDQDRSTALFRILQESLTNVARHSNATRVKIHLTMKSDHLLMEVTDNGKGITNSQINSPYSFGILGMRERAMVFGGEFTIKSSMESGTAVKVNIPIGKQ